MEKGEAQRLKKYLAGLNIKPLEDSLYAPEIVKDEEIGNRADIWFRFGKNKVGLEYTHYVMNPGWALAVAKEICKHFKVKKAGFEETGYMKSLDDFLKCKIFHYDIDLRTKLADLNTTHQKEHQNKLERLKKAKSLYIKEAKELFKGIS